MNRMILTLALISLGDPMPVVADDALIVAEAKQILVSSLDSDLPVESLEKWLPTVLWPQAKVKWYLSGCGLKPWKPEPPDGYPLCLDAEAIDRRISDQPRQFKILVRIGSSRRGIHGAPTFYHGFLLSGGDPPVTSFDRLSGAAAAVNGVAPTAEPK